MLRWTSLPTEIRIMILESIVQQHRGSTPLPYAPVCKEWQAVIEKKNFGLVKLRASDLNTFERKMRSSRLRGLVKHIWLNILLQKYDCSCCEVECNRCSHYKSNDMTVKLAISKPFSLLSTWEPTGKNLTLEISAQSPSDSKHWFKNLYFGAGGEDEDIAFESRNQLQEAAAKRHDPNHGWLNGQQVTAPSASALLRIFDEVWFWFKKPLPKVRAVTTFILRRQCRRRFCAEGLSRLLGRLPRLECIVYGPWRGWNRFDQKFYDQGYIDMMEFHLKGVKRLSIFEDFNEDYTTIFQTDVASYYDESKSLDAIRIPRSKVGAALARRSLELEQLSASFMIDARHFFKARQPEWTWNQLESLVLTSRLLTYGAKRGIISNLLHEAGAAALKMPRLHTMAIWNGWEGEAAVFMYRKGCTDPSIVWRGTWDLKLEPRVIEAWAKVAAKYTLFELRVEKQKLRRDKISSHGEAIHYLDLPPGVIDPVSLWQIRREGRIQSV